MGKNCARGLEYGPRQYNTIRTGLSTCQASYTAGSRSVDSRSFSIEQSGNK